MCRHPKGPRRQLCFQLPACVTDASRPTMPMEDVAEKLLLPLGKACQSVPWTNPRGGRGTDQSTTGQTCLGPLHTDGAGLWARLPQTPGHRE